MLSKKYTYGAQSDNREGAGLHEIYKKKIAVYTVIMGDYDYLKEPEFVMDNCDYICFTDNPDLKSDIWQIRYDNNNLLDSTRWQRRHKIMVHQYLSEIGRAHV